jgi:glycosyltransferase involved in cell wall biosynthesis
MHGAPISCYSMRIALWHNLPSGGAKRALYDQVAGLLKLGHEVESWCPPSADQGFLPLSDLVREHIVAVEQVRSSKARKVWELAHDKHVHVEAMNSHCLQCAREIDIEGFDVLFASACMEFRVTAIGRYVGVPSLLYLQEPHRAFYEAFPRPPWAADERSEGWWHSPQELRRATKRAIQVRRNEVQVREEVRNASAFSLIACNSMYSRESILRAYGLEAEVCYLGVDQARFTPGEGARRQFFLSVGYAGSHKNAAFIIRSLGRRRDKSWPLVWVANAADEHYVAEISELAKLVGVSLDIRFNVSDLELLQLYQTAGMFLYAPRLEPFGLAPLEAAACGLVTVGVAEAGTRESITDGKTGFLVQANEAAFADKIDEVLADQTTLDDLGCLARETVEREWGLDGAVLRLERLLQGVAFRGS